MTHQLTSKVVGRMATRAQGSSRTPDIPDDWEHVEAPGRPKKVPSRGPHNHKRDMDEEARYQKAWREWNERDVKARLEQWEAR